MLLSSHFTSPFLLLSLSPSNDVCFFLTLFFAYPISSAHSFLLHFVTLCSTLTHTHTHPLALSLPFSLPVSLSHLISLCVSASACLSHSPSPSLSLHSSAWVVPSHCWRLRGCGGWGGWGLSSASSSSSAHACCGTHHTPLNGWREAQGDPWSLTLPPLSKRQVWQKA